MSQVISRNARSGNHVLTAEQLQRLEHDGYLRVEGLLDPAEVIDPLFAEYEDVLDRLAHELRDRGEIASTYDDLAFSDRMIRVYQETGRDHASYFDCCLPSRGTTLDTPMWLGPAVFNILTHERVLDLVESVIGPEITSNPGAARAHQAARTFASGGRESCLGPGDQLASGQRRGGSRCRRHQHAHGLDLTLGGDCRERVSASDSGESSERAANPLFPPARRDPRRTPGSRSHHAGADATWRRDHLSQTHLPRFPPQRQRSRALEP